MLPRTPRQRGQPRTDRAIAIGFGLVIFGLMGVELAQRFRPANLSPVFILLAYAPLLVLHEAAHAVTAAALGWRVIRVVIGFGPRWARLRIHGVPIELHMFPISGFVVPAPRELAGARWRSALIFLAGPAAEAAVLGVLIVAVGYEPLTTRSDAISMIAVQSTAVAVLIGLFSNLIPIPTPDGTWTDGLGALASVVGANQLPAVQIAGGYYADAERWLEQGNVERASEVIRAGVDAHPDNLRLKLLLAELLVEQGEPRQAGQLLEPELDREGLPKPLRAALHHAVAVAARELGESETLDAAETHARTAQDLCPNETRYHIGRAALLVERRRYVPALTLLEQARQRLGSGDELLDECECFMALAEARRGRGDAARELLDGLTQRGARGCLVDRVRAECRAS